MLRGDGMKRLFCFVLAAMLLLCACSQYAEPDVSRLTGELISSQGLEDMTYADDTDVGILFGVELKDVEEYSVCYSGKGGYADMIAIFKLGDSGEPEAVAELLRSYKEHRYEDFKGYAPFEAEKVENGRVAVYDRYVLLVILPDISAAQDTLDRAFKK